MDTGSEAGEGSNGEDRTVKAPAAKEARQRAEEDSNCQKTERVKPHSGEGNRQ